MFSQLVRERKVLLKDEERANRVPASIVHLGPLLLAGRVAKGFPR